ncbi:hypothetical protein ACF0H5_002228 [Mactra antiquata]
MTEGIQLNENPNAIPRWTPTVIFYRIRNDFLVPMHIIEAKSFIYMTITCSIPTKIQIKK